MDAECTRDHLLDIAMSEFDWRRVGRRLLDSEQNIMDIGRDQPDEQNRRETMLMMWRGQKETAATYRVLARTFRQVQYGRIAEQVEHMVGESSNGECTRDHLLDTAEMDFDWRRVGRRLLDSDQNIADIGRDQPDEQNRRETMLMMWRSQKGTAATYKVLADTFRQAQYGRIAEKVEEMVGESSNGGVQPVPQQAPVQPPPLQAPQRPGSLGPPSLPLLISFPARGGNIDIIQRIGTSYSTFGIFLLNDDNGTKVDALKYEHHLNAEAITMAIFRTWLQGTGRRPITWGTLVATLRDVSLHALADQIEGVTKVMLYGGGPAANMDFGDYSTPITVTTLEDVPPPPTGLTTDYVKTKSMTISWQPPQDVNDIIRGYQVSYTPHGESECLHDVEENTTTTELTYLKPHTEYTIRVRAKTVDFGDYSTSITVTTLEDVEEGMGHLLDPEDADALFEVVKGAKAKWRDIGRELGFTLKEMDNIVAKKGISQDLDYFQELLDLWLNWAPPEKSVPCTVDLLEALRHIGQHRLAMKLEQCDDFMGKKGLTKRKHSGVPRTVSQSLTVPQQQFVHPPPPPTPPSPERPGLQDTPTPPLLLNFPVGEGATINIIQEIGTNYIIFGPHLLNDYSGIIMGALEQQYQQSAESINIAIFKKWFQGTGRRPVTWSTLVTVLRLAEVAELNTLANQIEGVYQPMSQPQFLFQPQTPFQPQPKQPVLPVSKGEYIHQGMPSPPPQQQSAKVADGSLGSKQSLPSDSRTLSKVEKELITVTEWKVLGQKLNIPDHVLANVDSDTTLRDLNARKRAMLKWWLDNDPEATWSKMAQALQDTMIYGNLAATIRDGYVPQPPQTQSVPQLPLQPVPQPSQPVPQPSQPVPQPSQPVSQPSQPVPQPSQPVPQQLQPPLVLQSQPEQPELPVSKEPYSGVESDGGTTKESEGNNSDATTHEPRDESEVLGSARDTEDRSCVTPGHGLQIIGGAKRKKQGWSEMDCKSHLCKFLVTVVVACTLGYFVYNGINFDTSSTTHPVVSPIISAKLGDNDNDSVLNQSNVVGAVVTKKDGDFYLVSSDGGPSNPAYKMAGKPIHGIALIISNKEFDGGTDLEYRAGGKVDEENLQELFGSKYLNYKVVFLKDLKGGQIDMAFQLVSGHVKYAEIPVEHKEALEALSPADSLIAASHDSFVCCLMSHGGKGVVYGTDGSEFDLDNIYNYLGECGHLTRKPKMIFIQACQGGGIAEHDGLKLFSPQTVEDDGPGEGVSTTKTADFLLSFAAFYGQMSFRWTNDGTWYMSALYNTFKENYKSKDVVSMITDIHNEVMEQKNYRNKDVVHKQCPRLDHTLRHNVHFYVKGGW